MAVDKQDKKASVEDVTIPSGSNIRAERGAVKDVGSKGISGAHDDRSTQDPQAPPASARGPELEGHTF